MTEQDTGASVPDQALAVPVEPQEGLAPSGFDPSRIRKMLWTIYMRIDTMPRSNLNMGLDLWKIKTFQLLRDTIELLSSNGGTPAAVTFAGTPEAGKSVPPSAIAMEARQGGDGETRLHPKDDSAGPKDIARKGSQ